jgi:hypothetical protein
MAKAKVHKDQAPIHSLSKAKPELAFRTHSCLLEMQSKVRLQRVTFSKKKRPQAS